MSSKDSATIKYNKGNKIPARICKSVQVPAGTDAILAGLTRY